MKTLLYEKIKDILVGIDKSEIDNPDGWWSSSEGVEFGEDILYKIKKLLEGEQ